VTKDQRFPQACQKLARGRQLADEADALMFAEFQKAFHFVEEPLGVHLVGLVVRQRAPIDDSVATMVLGDALNNMKSALDYAVWDLVREREAAGYSSLPPKEKKDVGFPHHDQAKDLPALANKKGQHAGSDAVALLTRMDATPGGAGHHLWQLSALNNIDKHRLLLTTMVAINEVRLGYDLGGGGPLSFVAGFAPTIVDDPHPLVDGHVLLGPVPEHTLHLYRLSFLTQWWFNESEVPLKNRVQTVVEACGQAVSDALDQLGALPPRVP
jgi:hypothetical protein